MVKLKIIGIILITILAIAGVALIVMPAISKDSENTMSVYFYDEDDELIQSITNNPLAFDWDFAIVYDDFVVAKIAVVMTYLVAFEKLGFEDVNIVGNLVWTVNALDSVETELFTGEAPAQMSDDWQDSFAFIIYTEDLIPDPDKLDGIGKEWGWRIHFTAALSGSATVDGETVHPEPWTDTAYVDLGWDADIPETNAMTFVTASFGVAPNQ